MKTYLNTAIFVALLSLISVLVPSAASAQIFQYPYLSPYTPAYIPQVVNSNYNVFYRDLSIGSSGSDVTALQTFLESRGFLVMPYGVAKGYFGALTQAALARYQASVGIYPAYGYFDATTRVRVAAEYGGGYNSYNNCTYAYAYNCNNTYPPYQNPVSNAYIRVVNPSGGETFRSGDLITIQWDAYSFNNTRPFEICLVNYRDDCYRSLGTVYPDTYNRNVTTRFIDSSIPTGDYKIKVTGYAAGNSYLGGYFNDYSYNVPISDQSDNWFRIVSGSGSGNFEITPSYLPEARVGNYYNQLLRAESYGSYYNDNYYDNNYNNNISWRVISGSLPSGLYIERDYNNNYYNEPYRAYIRGTTYSTGTYNFTIEVSDRYRTATRQYTIVVTN